VDEGIDKHEHPDWRRHVADAGPYTQHCSCVMVGLQKAALLALGKNNRSIDDLVELREIKEPAVEGETLVPNATDISALGAKTIGSQMKGAVRHCPCVASFVERGGAPEASGTMNFAQAVSSTSEAMFAAPTSKRVHQRIDHTNAGPCRVQCKDCIMQDDQNSECACLTEGPRLVFSPCIDGVEVADD
jgi:hypothetical protein